MSWKSLLCLAPALYGSRSKKNQKLINGMKEAVKGGSIDRKFKKMTIHRAHQIELIVNEKQELYLKKAVGCARFAFNWGIK